METAEQVLAELQSMANPANVAGMARYGINPQGTLGISIPFLRQKARQLGRNQVLAEALWDSGVHEARILASLVADPAQTTGEQMERWVADFDSWDVCDQVCSNLFDRSPLARQKAIAWSSRPETFVKRAGFVLMAALASHDKQAGDEVFEAFFPLMVREASDDRNFVKKAISWALRGIGKRNRRLNARAIETARQIGSLESRPTRWIAADVLRELTGEKVQGRLRG